VIDEFIKQIELAASADEAAHMLIDTFRDEITIED
jgi:hypothetical protein